MKLKSLRAVAAALVLCACMTACSSTAAVAPAQDTAAYKAVTYTQDDALLNGERVYITGTPDYGDTKSSASGNLFAFRTANKVWYVLIGDTSVAKFSSAVSAGQMKLYGAYSGALSESEAPVLDIQNGYIETSGKRVKYSAAVSAGTQTAATQQTGTAATGSQNASSANKSIGSTVYVAGSGNGKCYHSSPNCSNMKKPRAISLSEAQRYYKPCSKCC